MPNKIKMKSLNLSGSQAQIVIKSLNERLYEFDEELDALESRIIEIRMKKSQLNNLLAELGETPAGEGPKKRGRKPGSGKKAAEASDAPKKRGRKPGSGKKAAEAAAAPKKRGRKPGSKSAKAAAPKAAPGKRGRKPATEAKTAAPQRTTEGGKKAAAKATPKKAAKAAVKAAPKAAVPAKTEAKTAAKKAEAPGKRGRKSGGENTLAAKIVTAITDAKKGLTTREIVDSLNSRYGAEKDERKLIQAISSTLISLTKRGKIKRETGKDGQILNIVVS